MSTPTGESLVAIAQAVQTREDFVAFLQLLLKNYRESPEGWENTTLEGFLEGLGGFAASMDGYYSMIGTEIDLKQPGWRVIADLLLAARVYE